MEGKTRVIAILDYWSQNALYPLHSFLFRILRKIPQDMTFNQGTAADTVKSWGNVKLFSIDLTTATDRFPIDLIASVLRGKFPESYVLAWVDVMVGYPFHTPTGDRVSYSVGNPMGAYSSWASFALAHHFVMYWCCEELGLSWRHSKYVILGDDVLVGHERLGKLYHSKILSLGMEVSPLKTFVSWDLCEFAKRYIYKREEVTPFPVSSVIENLGDVSLLVSAIMGESKKGYYPRSGVPGCVRSLADSCLHVKASMQRNMELRANDCEAVTLFLQDKLDPGQFLLRVSRESEVERVDALLSDPDRVIREGIRRTLRDSLGPDGKYKMDVMLNAEIRTLLKATQLTGVGADFILDLPLLRVFRRFEEPLPDLETVGAKALSSLDEVQKEYLGGFFVNPLKDRS